MEKYHFERLWLYILCWLWKPLVKPWYAWVFNFWCVITHSSLPSLDVYGDKLSSVVGKEVVTDVKNQRRVSRHSFAQISASRKQDSLHAVMFGTESVIRGLPLINFISTLFWMIMESPCIMILLMRTDTNKEYMVITYSPPFSVIYMCSILSSRDIQEGVLEINKTWQVSGELTYIKFSHGKLVQLIPTW